MNDNSFEGKVTLIIGGASGVGKSVALEVARLGGQVVVADLSFENWDESVFENVNRSPRLLDVNLRDLSSLKGAFDIVATEFGRLDGLFCYAGVTYASDLLSCDESHFDEVMDVNFKGTLFSCRYAIELMKASGGGAIVLNGSPHAWGGDKDRIVYACSKGALFPLMDHIAKHYAGAGIRANLVTMGWTPTEGELSLRRSQGMSENELRQWASSIIPAGRMTEVQDIVRGVVYLLSNYASMVSGSNLRVTGGWYL